MKYLISIDRTYELLLFPQKYEKIHEAERSQKKICMTMQRFVQAMKPGNPRLYKMRF